jgi:hypothetical protein
MVDGEFIRWMKTLNLFFWPDWSNAHIIFASGFAGHGVLNKDPIVLLKKLKFNCGFGEVIIWQTWNLRFLWQQYVKLRMEQCVYCIFIDYRGHHRKDVEIFVQLGFSLLYWVWAGWQKVQQLFKWSWHVLSQFTTDLFWTQKLIITR